MIAWKPFFENISGLKEGFLFGSTSIGSVAPETSGVCWVILDNRFHQNLMGLVGVEGGGGGV